MAGWNGAEVPRPRSRTSRLVLVTEDDAAVRASLKGVLESAGYGVIEAQEGAQALSLLGNEAIEVMILDLLMPGYDGLWVLDQLDAPPPQVIIYSASEHLLNEDFRQLYASKVFCCLTKPGHPLDLLDTVARAFAATDSQRVNL